VAGCDLQRLARGTYLGRRPARRAREGPRHGHRVGRLAMGHWLNVGASWPAATTTTAGEATVTPTMMSAEETKKGAEEGVGIPIGMLGVHAHAGKTSAAVSGPKVADPSRRLPSACLPLPIGSPTL
jgi:hypothetical protein